MPAVSPSNGQRSTNRILPSWMWPSGQDIGALDTKYYTAQSADKREGARFNRSTANELTQTTEGALSDATINSHMEHAVRHDLLADIAEAGLRAARRVSRLRHELVTSLDNIEACGQQALSSSPSAMHPTIRAAAVTDAQATLSAFSAAATASYTYATREAAPAFSALNVRKPIPNDKDSALDNKGLDSRSDKPSDQGGLGSRPEKLPGGQSDQTAGPGGLAQRQDNAPSGSPTSGKSQQAGSGGLEQRGDLAGGVRSSTQPSPLSATGLSGGGLPGSGGGLSSGGLGSGGLGSGSSPLSALTSGMGRMPQTSGLTQTGGASGLPTSGLGSGVDPASFGRAVSAGSAAAGVTSSPVAASPPLAGPSTAPVTTGVGPSSVSGPSAVSAGLAGPGQHVPASGPATPPATGVGAAGAGGMLLPSPGLGAPAAPGGVASTPASVSAPATAPPSGSSSSGGGGSTSTGPTLIPAGVATPVAVARGGSGKSMSADVLSAAALTWQLAQAGDLQGYPMDWAVGVFRSPIGTETVVMSNDGWGYVPFGVFLPRSARLLVSDPVADGAFRDVWFGWSDPARIMVEYAKLRVEGDWKLVAAATTGSADSLREAGVDHTVVNRDKDARPKGLPADWEPPGQDGQHQHRLELGHRDLFERLEKLSGVGRRYQERVIYPLCAALMNCLVGVDEIPQILRSGWHKISCGHDLSAAEWAELRSACTEKFAMVGAKRPGGSKDIAEHSQSVRPQDLPAWIHLGYRAQWVLARAMEQFGGWAATPMPLSDMVYAAFAAERIDVRAVLEEPLRTVEEDCA